jgi:DNA transposition AAA+ family ATPase
MITTEIKQRVVAEIKARKGNYKSQAAMARALGINAAQMSRVLKGEVENVLSDANFVSIARKLGVELRQKAKWVVAKTPVFNFVWKQLEMCQSFSFSGLLCDVADIGKTFTAEQYVKSHRNAVLIDCSQVKSKQRLIRKIAQEFGLNSAGKYVDVYDDLVFYLKSIESPLIILDEAGDLDYPAFLELKALWNATEHAVGWYMMGADGLKAKIERNRNNKKVGYTELFSRFGNKYQRISPDGKEAKDEFTREQVALIALANGIDKTALQKVYAKTGGSLRRIHFEVQKLKRQAA